MRLAGSTTGGSPVGETGDRISGPAGMRWLRVASPPSLELVLPFREAGEELRKRQLVEGRLRALEEQPGEALGSHVPAGHDVQERLLPRVENPRPLPGLTARRTWIPTSWALALNSM
jgi:hypothetical protein